MAEDNKKKTLPPLRPTAKNWAEPTEEELAAQKEWDALYAIPSEEEPVKEG